ncbi:MAG TPA: O-methyltransferase [Solirubrobacterales bacterium]|nr:O-methyltransferase [Solirubrobacterales bacterium]
MTEAIWSAVDEYIAATLAGDDEALEAAVHASEEAGLPSIQVSPPQGKLLYLLAGAIGATSILEFGTLGGYSTIWLARALPPGGRLLTLEAEPRNAEIARRNVDRAGLGGLVDLRVGTALDLLPGLEAENVGPFDLTFIDADKVNTPDYFAWSLDRSRAGSLIVADNVVRGGTLAEADSDDPTPAAQRRLHEQIAADPRVSATTIQTVGSKGYDGFTLALVGER